VVSFLWAIASVVRRIESCLVVILLMIWIFRFGFGNGWCYTIVLGMLSVRLIWWILFLNNMCNGSISLNCRLFGSLFML